MNLDYTLLANFSINALPPQGKLRLCLDRTEWDVGQCQVNILLVTTGTGQAHVPLYLLVLFDLVGAGGSDLAAYDPGKYSTLQGYADDLLEIIETLELTNVVFVGHSVSGMVGVLAAIRRPEWFAKLVLGAPSPRYVNDVGYVGGLEPADIEELLEMMDRNYLGWSSTMAPVIMGNPERPQLAEGLTNSFCRTNPDIARHFGRVTFLADNRADLPQLRTPALILQCTDDVIAPVAVGRYLHQQLAHSELALLEVSGHCPHLSAPDAPITAIRRSV